MLHHNCNHSQAKRYQYKGCWIEVFIEADFKRDRLLYVASVEIPGGRGVIKSSTFESREEAEFAAEELVESWNWPMNKYQIDNWEQFEWNTGDDWAIPLPAFPVNEEIVRKRWFIPDEAPVIPTGWIYELFNGEIVSQYILWSRFNSQDGRAL